MTPRTVAVVGSTGSIGTQALDVVAAAPDRFAVVALAAGGGRPELLAQQAAATGAPLVAVADETRVAEVRDALGAACRTAGRPAPRVVAGPQGVCEAAAAPADVVLNGMTGSAGLAPTLAALDAGRVLALANKESLVAGGPLVLDRLDPAEREHRLVPVDSEHSALAQCLRGGRREEVARLVLTASGGPFRGRTRDELDRVTPEQALAHPTWAMGPVVTLNSATLVNKGLEVIEAHLLFGVPYDDVAVVVHPQSVVHSMVEFSDGSTLTQASPPDMRLPIALALAWPDRVPGAAAPCDWSTAATWTFEPLDGSTFPAVDLAVACGRRGGVVPAALNAANEECVQAFVDGRLPFLGIVDTVAEVVADVPHVARPSLDDVLAAEGEARRSARARVARLAES